MKKDNKADSQLLTLLGHGQTPAGIPAALEKSSGSRFYKCAFQINPFSYGGRHAKDTGAADEQSYNEAMAAACLEAGIEVAAITDHFRADTSQSLARFLTGKGITVFPAFEANSSEGVHILCLFPPETSQSEMNHYIGACDLRDADSDSPISSKRFEEILSIVHQRGGIAIAAHVTNASGLLTKMSGKPRAHAWKSDLLLAAAIPGRAEDVPQDHKGIVKNTDPEHRRDRTLALINAADVSNPAAAAQSSASTLVKMSAVSIEGLRQGFLDHESRIRLNTDPPVPEYSKIVAVAWEGGLLGGQNLMLNAGLNVLVGGRGAGKSTVIESLRFAFELRPKGKEAGRSHDSMIKELMGAKSAVAVLVYSPSPSPQYYLIERAYGQSARVKNQAGDIIDDFKPLNLMPAFEIYGQHEISELTRDKAKLAEILERFVGESDVSNARLADIRSRLSQSRAAITAKLQKLEELEQALAVLPLLKEQLKRFSETDLADKLSEKTAVLEEKRILDGFDERIGSLRTEAAALKPDGDGDKPVLPPEDETALPHRATLEPLVAIAESIDAARKEAAAGLSSAADSAAGKLAEVRSAWLPLFQASDERYDKLVKQLESEGHDPQKYVSIKTQVADLKPKETERNTLEQDLASLRRDRAAIIDEWEKADRAAFADLEKAAKRVSRKLAGSVRAGVRPSSNLDPLRAIVGRHVAGNVSAAFTRLEALDDLSLSELARTVRKGADPLVSAYGIPEATAQKIAAGGEALALEIEECRLAPEAVIELNVRSGTETWKDLDRLSAGQRATAVLMLLLLEAAAPLIVDQPEDDLDNQFIVDHVVKTMRTAKDRRQFVFSSHNPNIPVLGDAEQIIGLTPEIEDGRDRTKIYPDHCGAIDTPAVKELIKIQLEGGEQAFHERKKKYGF